MFSKILIANRGEIAVRIIRACKEMGITAVAVYSEADTDTLHAALADECICIGPAHAKDSYLNKERIISAALASGAQAIHPGYGFLSENAEFAEMCRSYGITFIGPRPEVVRRLGDKNNARQLAKELGVPTVPGSGILASYEEAEAAANVIGYPLLIKASAGGGGKGIRIAENKEQLKSAYISASEEAKMAFGCGDVYMERYLTHCRHVEMQILADEFGNIIPLGERDCSLQRNKQKVIEETPCPVIRDGLRARMAADSVRMARAAGYTNAGTIEFLLDPDGKYYFMEMNTRLQVEHPVTEEISCVDLVKWQIRIASRKPLDFTADDVILRGHSIECRINARSGGEVKFLHVPGGARIRFDTALLQGTKVTPYYDSMLGKLIVYAGSREDAIRKMEAALCELVIQGVETNIDDQLAIVRSRAFRTGEYDTGFLDLKQ